MAISSDQKNKAILFRRLHRGYEMLILPNIWDPLGAAMLEKTGYPAVATASAALAYAAGYDDGENIPFEELLFRLSGIVKKVNVPVTADIESGYASDPDTFQSNLRKLITTGIAGINIEDSNPGTHALLAADAQCERIRMIRQVSAELDIPLFINARVDVFIHPAGNADPVSETLGRARAYLEAGADGIYPILLKEEAPIRELVKTLQAPLNIILLPGGPDIGQLRNMGVSRVSLGHSFLKVTLKTMKEFAERLKSPDGPGILPSETLSTDYIKSLVDRPDPDNLRV